MDNHKRSRSQAERVDAIQRQMQQVETVLDLFKHEGWVVLVSEVENDLHSLESTLHDLTTPSPVREQAAVAVSIYRKLLDLPQFFSVKLKGLQKNLTEATATPDRSWMERILTFIR